MSSFRLTKAAQEDLRKIGYFTRNRWGREQAKRYLQSLDACFHRLAENPQAGKPYGKLPPYWRIVQSKHVVFYRIFIKDTPLIVRVLHGRMLPELHLYDSENETW
jgi:toxin ParE1/3/4